MALQKSIREGIGLTVAEAKWEGAPVVGIGRQIQYGESGYPASSAEQAGACIRPLPGEDLWRRMGEKQKRQCARFLVARYPEQHLDLFSSFEASYRFRFAKISPAECKLLKRTASDRADRR